jgi:hypothetical protein
VDKDTAGQGYVEHLTDEDLRVLAGLANLSADDAGELRRRPSTVVDLLERPELFTLVYGQDPASLLRISPFLAFVVAVGQAAREIAAASFVVEPTGPRERVPVFDTPRLRAFLTDPMHRLFLAELLTSFVRVASGRYWRRTRHGWRSQRYNELDPVRLAQFVEQAPEANRPGLYRRLGDVALFLTGVFPDYAQRYAFGPFDAARLLRAAGLSREHESELVTAPPIQLLEHLGRRWYRLAAELAPVQTTQLTVVTHVAERFSDARRVLNHVSDRQFWRSGDTWFDNPRW